jgi:hypothetical protein
MVNAKFNAFVMVVQTRLSADLSAPVSALAAAAANKASAQTKPGMCFLVTAVILLNPPGESMEYLYPAGTPGYTHVNIQNGLILIFVPEETNKNMPVFYLVSQLFRFPVSNGIYRHE